MPRQSDRFIIGEQLLQLIELEILDSDSSSSNDSDLELLDMLSSDCTSTDSIGVSDRDLDIVEDSESDRDEDVVDLVFLADALEQSRYLTRGLRLYAMKTSELSTSLLEDVERKMMLEMDNLAHMHTKFVELANQYEDMRSQMRDMHEAVRSSAEEVRPPT
ncbi:hypothetical protein R1sor_003036 [Riccia sorocarpa]|uniref:Uncharacterized protein n=1 Tax=Riccia sorocarpa TaxID=122646 RepID=A0ABD3H4C8_9MARC